MQPRSNPTMLSWEAAKQKGNAAYATKDFTGALSLYTQALQLNAPDSQTHTLLGNRFPKAWFRKAAALEGLNQLPQALQALQQAQLHRPKDPQIQEAIARMQARLPITQQENDAMSQSSNKTVKPLEAVSRQPQRAAKLPAGSIYRSSADGIDENLLILLHGYGDTPDAYARLAHQMALPQTASLALAGPLGPIPGTACGRAWYNEHDEAQPYSQGCEESSSVLSTLKWLQQVVADLQSSAGWRASHMHLFGFSQGGTAALHLALQHREDGNLGSCVAVSAALLPQQLGSLKSNAAAEAAASTTPILITHGSKDLELTRQAVKATVTAAKQAGSNVQLHSVPGKGHAMMQGPDEVRILMAFWAQQLKHRPVQQSSNAVGSDLVEIQGGLGVLA